MESTKQSYGGIIYAVLIPDIFQPLLLNYSLIKCPVSGYCEDTVHYPAALTVPVQAADNLQIAGSCPSWKIYIDKKTLAKSGLLWSTTFPWRSWILIRLFNTATALYVFPPSAQTPPKWSDDTINSAPHKCWTIFHNPISVLTARGQPIPTQAPSPCIWYRPIEMVHHIYPRTPI